jgi:uncharacterized protein (DUF1800 family)
MRGSRCLLFQLVLLALLMPLSGFAQPTGQSRTATSPATPIRLDQPMGEALARDMLGRFGFGATAVDVARVSQWTPRAYIEYGIRGDSPLPPAVATRIAAMSVAGPLQPLWEAWGPGSEARETMRTDETKRKEFDRAERRFVQEAIQARLLAMANSPNQGHEALLAFWLNHFSIFGVKDLDKLLAFDYARRIEAAMKSDSFEALLRASFFHPAMQFFLDNVRSTAPNSEAGRMAGAQGRELGINENLARELMALHTLGVDGGYSQTDIQELARIITGAGAWVPRMVDRNLERAGAVRDGLFLFDPRRHDPGAKNLLGETFPAASAPEAGMREIERALHLLASHPSTSRHLSRKLAQRFLADEPSESTVAAMARAWRESNGRVSNVLFAMMATPEFARSLATRAKFREPLDQVLFTARAACQGEVIANAEMLAAAAVDNGQAPYMRSTPDGYGAREADWFSPAAIAKRVRFAMNVAVGRAPLLANGTGGTGRGPERAGENEMAGQGERDMSGENNNRQRPRILEGESCRADPDTVAQALGPLSAATRDAASNLPPRERVAVLLSSPEALRR